mgnify:FL=1|tara:strand:+ start:758 stop:1081 length:324 start_codon:yes stop_codon:yes gene_type:complete
MSLKTFLDTEARYMKSEAKKYHKAYDYLLGFVDDKQWKQAIIESLTDTEISYSVMEDIFEDYVEDYSIDLDAEQLIYEACEEVLKTHPNNDVAQIIKANIERRRNRV